MVGWPANGTSACAVKISIFSELASGVGKGEVDAGGRCKNTISERLNSEAIACFCSCVN